MDNSINNNIHIAKQNPADNPNAVSSQKSYDAQQSLDKSIFGINDKKLNNDTKKMWEKSFKDIDGDGNVSEGDFTQEELSMSNGSKTFKDYLGGIMGKPWKLAENVITNIKAMFIKSAPANTVKSQGASEIIDYIKENKLKVGDTFEYNGIKYTVGQNNTAIAQADNYESKIETYSDGKTSISTYMEDQMNTTVTDENNNKISERSDYDDGSAQIKIYENGQQSADITIRAPKSENEIPFIRIRE